MLVFLNPAAGGGRAHDRWDRIAPRLSCDGIMNVCLLATCADNGAVLLKHLRKGERHIVAAGGDGTVNSILSSLMADDVRQGFDNIILGAVGLGSSNDFHKPLDRATLVQGIPCRLNFASARYRDVGKLTLVENGAAVNRYFINNASVGVTADANHLFNHPDRMLGILKQISTSAAILYAATRTIANGAGLTATIHTRETGPMEVRISNLGIVKNNHFSGNLRYEPAVALSDGLLGIHLCNGMSRRELAGTLIRLSKGRFNGLPHTRSWTSSSVLIRANRPFTVEFDGETLLTETVRFSVQQNALKVCA